MFKEMTVYEFYQKYCDKKVYFLLDPDKKLLIKVSLTPPPRKTIPGRPTIAIVNDSSDEPWVSEITPKLPSRWNDRRVDISQLVVNPDWGIYREVRLKNGQYEIIRDITEATIDKDRRQREHNERVNKLKSYPSNQVFIRERLSLLGWLYRPIRIDGVDHPEGYVNVREELIDPFFRKKVPIDKVYIFTHETHRHTWSTPRLCRVSKL